MNLVGRFFFFLLSAIFYKGDFDPMRPVKSRFRVWPHDIDVNIHLTAARYLSFADLGRVQWLIRNGLIKKFFTHNYRSVLNAQEITYIREFKPLSRLDLFVELKCWDKKYGYFEQRFYHKGDLFAVGHARMAMIHKGKVVSLGDVFSKLGHELTSNVETEAIKDWKETLNAKKAYFS